MRSLHGGGHAAKLLGGRPARLLPDFRHALRRAPPGGGPPPARPKSRRRVPFSRKAVFCGRGSGWRRSLLFNAKGLFVLAACAIFGWDGLLARHHRRLHPAKSGRPWLSRRHLAPSGLTSISGSGPRSMPAARLSPTPSRTASVRTANWLGFHAVLVAGAFWFCAEGTA